MARLNIFHNFAPFSGMRSLKVPHFRYYKHINMIDKNTVKTIVDEWLTDKDYFLVSIEIDDNDRIVVEIDHADGVWIDDCADLSHFIEERLNRDDEDYELEVGSAGLGQPFKVEQQYHNFVGKEVDVMTAEGKKLTGTLVAVDGRKFTVRVLEKVTLEGRKRPVKQEVEHEYDMDSVKYCKYHISFK